MPSFKYAINALTLSAGSDLVTYVSASARRARVIELELFGDGTSSAANTVTINRSTAGTTGGGAITAAKNCDDAPSPAGSCFTTWSSQPTQGANGEVIGVNSNGGINRFVAVAGKEPEARNANNISIRCLTGSGVVSGHLIVEEDFS